MIHSNAHPMSRQTVRLTSDIKDGGPAADLIPAGTEFHVEDWYDRLNGDRWSDMGNYAALNYAIRAQIHGLPLDDEVVYGKIGFLGYLVHQSEIN